MWRSGQRVQGNSKEFHRRVPVSGAGKILDYKIILSRLNNASYVKQIWGCKPFSQTFSVQEDFTSVASLTQIQADRQVCICAH